MPRLFMPEQHEALALARTTPRLLIEGPMGSGLTLTTARIAQDLAARGEQVLTLAGTGRAAKRLEEQGAPATTLHAILTGGPASDLLVRPEAATAVILYEPLLRPDRDLGPGVAQCLELALRLRPDARLIVTLDPTFLGNTEAVQGLMRLGFVTTQLRQPAFALPATASTQSQPHA